MVYAIKCHACHKIYIGETGRRLGDRFREHVRSTRLPDSQIPVRSHFPSSGHTTQDMLVSVIRSGFRDVSSKVSARCKRCDFCFYLSVTSHARYSVAFRPRMRTEHPRNVWLTFTISFAQI